ncbi:hypothetical protein DL767_004591 [Monosporascus sp. MG133]|nr:hypothetical protein DL767_004591 [Monosporascus sp. MG133]
MTSQGTWTTEPIAIVGSSCRFPGGINSPSKLWDRLKDPVDLSSEIPPARFNPKGFYHPNGEHHGSTNVTHAYLLKDGDQEIFNQFDHEFFNIHPREAESMDPQQRFLLETIYEGIESAGYSIEDLKGSSTAVFVGQMTDDYRDLSLRDVDTLPQYLGTGTSRAIVANRVSYFFDWKGPSMTIDTACSSSLVALHQAVQALRNGESQLAVAAGANLILGPEMFIIESSLHMLSPTGKCHMWDAAADGYARGEGFAAVVVKTLKQAIADNDHIECIIRETSVNQDGRSAGITVPSSTSQTTLIESTYRKCGLDPRKRNDRCQYFEAHGTGTKVGDPKEAKAIRNAFFPVESSCDASIDWSTESSSESNRQDETLYVGSIKTVIGHLEGAAGLAGLLKASAAVQHGKIPPNLHFNQLNPSIEPFYKNLRVPTGRLHPWPELPPGVPRRASVNSFGFGGTNAHAIIENWEPGRAAQESNTDPGQETGVVSGPILLSAKSTGALTSTVAALSKALEGDPRIRLEDLSWTLQARRTPFPFRAAFSATNKAQLIKKLRDSAEMSRNDPQYSLSTRAIALVDLLKASGITFNAVVGHSSGEIAAAYAAGYLTAKDAIRIAYYRGLHSYLSKAANGQPGKMMAVGMTLAEAEKFCAREEFLGRLKVAASNSQSSITLSGDADAIDEAKAFLDVQKTFSRVLKVDKAYHSHHMEPSSRAYLESLRQCDIEPQRMSVEGDCNWYSSVHGLNGRSIHDPDAFRDIYWADNMIKPVLFSQALSRAVQEENCFDIVLEVGPHPALKGPATETLKALTGVDIPYHGILKRNDDDVNAYSDALGFIWRNIQSPVPVVDFDRFRTACNGRTSRKPQVQKGLPPYCWDHDRPLFKESRRSKIWRTQSWPVDELLGKLTSMNGEEIRWRNIIKLSEMEWLQGHQFQGQVLFPAAGYVSMVMNAALQLVQDQPVNLLELQDLTIHNAIALEDGSSGVEVVFVIRVLERDFDQVIAQYSCYSGEVEAGSSEFERTIFTGRVVVTLGDPTPDALAPRRVPELPMTDIDLDRFYMWLRKCGLDYSGDFLVDSMKRRLNVSTVAMRRKAHRQYRFHPATLDAAFQGFYSAFAFPGDGRLRSIYLPTSIRKVRINMATCPRIATCEESGLVVDCHLTETTARTIHGDLDIFCAEDNHPEVQAQGVVYSSFENPSATNDRRLFARTVWKKDIGSGIEADDALEDSSMDDVLREICDRASYFYLQRLCKTPRHATEPLEPYVQSLIDWARELTEKVESGHHTIAKTEWKSDSWEMVMAWEENYHDQIDLQLIHRAADNIISRVSKTTPTDQVVMDHDMINRLYREGLGFIEARSRLRALVGQLVHQYPDMYVLEVGSRTGDATLTALESIVPSFGSYTLTDPSQESLEKTRGLLSQCGEHVKGAVLDIGRPPGEQGFKECSFDLIIACNASYATESLPTALENCRWLLRPGGRIILMEPTSDDIRTPFIFSGFSSASTFRPPLTEARWNILLRDSRFSGVDLVSRSKHGFSVMVSQAVDERVELLREPLASVPAHHSPVIDDLVIVSGSSLQVSQTALRTKKLLRPYASNIIIVDSLEDVEQNGGLRLGCAVICLGGLEEADFKKMNETKFRAIKSIFSNATYVLWATRGSRGDDPDANIIVGMGRSASLEYPHLRLQFVDVDRFRDHAPEPVMFSEMLLRMTYLARPDYADTLLWSQETELAIENGKVYIPRVIPDNLLNDRLSARIRAVQKSVSPTTSPLALVKENGSFVLEEGTFAHDYDSSSGNIEVKVESSSAFAFSTSDSRPFYICAGHMSATHRRVVVMSSKNQSLIRVPYDQTFNCSSNGKAVAILGEILTSLLCESILNNITGTLWVHDADGSFIEVASKVAKSRGVHLFSSTSSPKSSRRATFIHPRTTERELKLLIPRDTQRFVDMGARRSDLVSLLESSFDNEVDIAHVARSLHNKAYPLSYDSAKLYELLSQSLSNLDPTYALRYQDSQSSIPVDTISQYSDKQRLSSSTVIDWKTSQALSVRVRPVNMQGFFSDQKTYFLVGLTGDVGLSLCEWMIDHGARHFALSSRNPKIDAASMRHLQKKGGILRVFSLDITDKARLREVYAEIAASMPPIGGVYNGAMTLRDSPLDSMSWADFNLVLQPKVEGSKNLDELFYSAKLDFFVLFSSLSGVVGNPAQSNYAAANMCMASLAAQRRKRGLAASVMDIGMLLGIGLMNNAHGAVEEHMRNMDYMAISEPEFHVVCAEALLGGRPDSGLDPELITGIGEELDTPWRRVPRFWHYRLKDKATAESPSQVQRNNSVQGQLKETRDSKEALSILEGAFATKLGAVLRSSSENIDKGAPLVTLGIDSLVAVEIRSWFLKELAVDVPVLKILGGASLVDVCRDVLGKIPAGSQDVKKEVDSQGPGKPAVEKRSRSPTPPPLAGPPQTDPATSSVPTSSNTPNLTPRTSRGSSPMSDSFTDKSKGHRQPAPTYERTGLMSHAQAQLYFLHEYLDDKSAYNAGYTGKLHGRLDIPRLKKAIHAVGMRHESLRTSYFMDKSADQAIQAVNAEPCIILEHKYIGSDNEVRTEIEKLKYEVFDIENGQVMKVAVLSETPSLHHMVFFHHHIALDGQSFSLFLQDLTQAYSGQMPSNSVQQAIDMAKKKSATYSKESLQQELAFWSELYRAPPPESLPPFPFSKVKTRQALKSYDMHTVDIKLDANFTKLIKQAAAGLQVTSFSFYLSTLAVYLARCLNVEDVSIGIVEANRTQAEDFQTIGHFLNMLPLRFQLQRDEPFSSVAKRSRDVVFPALANARVPFDMILDHLDVPRSSSTHPLFQVAMNYRSGFKSHTPLGDDGTIEWTGGVPARNPYDLVVNVTETPDWTLLSFITQKYLYERSDTELMLGWYTRALENLARNPSFNVANYPMSSETDITQSMKLGLGRAMDIAWEGTLAHHIDSIAGQQPDSVAVRDKDGHGQTLTYSQLICRSMRIANELRNNSIPAGSYVAMLLGPEADAICVLMAVIRLGLVWVPLDLRNHHKRLASMVLGCQPRILVCNDATQDQARELATETTLVVNLDTMSSSADNIYESVENVSERSQPAALFYTSGSTGVPKGVILTHENILNQIYGNVTQFGIGREVVLQNSSFGFDLILEQTFHALAMGGTLVMASKESRGNPTQLAELMLSEGVTFTHIVPSEYLPLLHYGSQTLRKCKRWRWAFSGGEPIGPELRRAFQKLNLEGLELINAYGPLETTLACARGVVPYRTDDDVLTRNDRLRPSPNYSISIVDEQMNPVPIGFPGEVCISGAGIGLGYLNLPDETRRKFVQVTKAPNSGAQQWLKAYRSGDRGRLLPNGSLEILGRLEGDSQVKLRGIRIELDEIANVIVQASKGAIINAAVSLRRGSDVLAAFVVYDTNFRGDRTEFAEWLKSDLPLPPYMRPAFIVATDRIPTNANGKKDRLAIDNMHIPSEQGAAEVLDQLNAMEQSMKEVWQEVLAQRTARTAKIDANSDFFHVGGNSMLLIKLRSVLQGTFGVTLSLPELFQASTLRSMAARVAKTNEATPVQHIDWNIEVAALAHGLAQPRGTSMTIGASSSLAVLLTGATGFLGRHILKRLVEDDRIKEVHCIAIRPDALGHPRHVALKSEKVIEYSGNLSDRFLGLSESEFGFLAENIDLIIHNGAEVSFLKTYSSLRRANVVSTRTLCEMGIPRSVPFHFVSTGSVAKFTDKATLPEVSISEYLPPSDSSDGYGVSKWVSEVLLEKASADNGLPTWIHRPSSLVGDGAPALDLIDVIFKYARMLGAVPKLDSENATGAFDLIAVEDVAKDLVDIALRPLRPGQQPEAHFVHHCSDVKIPPESLKDYLEKLHGVRLGELPVKDWLDAALHRGLSQLLYDYLAGASGGQKLVIPLIEK